MTRHIILSTYGEPPSAEYLAQLRYSWRILLGLTRTVAPIPRPLVPLIAVRRAWLRNRSWTAERYGSPLEPITRAQAEGLGVKLRQLAPEVPWKVHVGYEFRDPLVPVVLDQLPRGDRVAIVPMYAVDSAFTHEITRASLRHWVGNAPGRRDQPPRAVSVVPPMDLTLLAELSIRQVRLELVRAGWRGGSDVALVLAAHGTLLEPPRPMETGREATQRLAHGIIAGLQGEFGLIVNGWLNHVYGGRWTEPPIEEALRQVATAGLRRVVYYPYGFLADNAESQLEGRVALRGHPDLEALHVPCLNASPDYLEALARQVLASESFC